MWRAIVMSIGLCLVILGGEAMVVDRVTLANGQSSGRIEDSLYGNTIDSPYSTSYEDLNGYASTSAGRVITPPEWAPWGLLSAGVLTFLYASALGTGE